ncbi:MAG: prepilin-type N-terminal cleavage/methylation domain-containing protein [Candidatus Omnitrophica bacterium]|nr:prepilin-type N-terminal cleavage/methylation domain-containing protein [Candidatus Omnitrophota bacterium]
MVRDPRFLGVVERMGISDKKGFTLLEMVVSVALALSVLMGVYGAFSGGIDLWQWMRANKNKGELAVFFARFEQDMANSIDLGDKGFKGDDGTFRMFLANPDLYLMRADEMSSIGITKGEAIRTVEYDFIEVKKEIRRKIYAFGSDEPQSDIAVLDGVESVIFAYYVPDGGKPSLVREDKWEGKVPFDVEISIVVESKGNTTDAHKRVFEKPFSA